MAERRQDVGQGRGKHSAGGEALAGLRVLEFCGGVPGPLCGMYLGDLGAEVIKVEPPTGDRTRRWGGKTCGSSPSYLSVNRNKQSLVASLTDPAARDRLSRLLSSADVVLSEEGHGQQAVAELVEEAVGRCPRMIWCVIGDFGERGPWSTARASELVVQAMSGIHRYLGCAGEPPLRVGFEMAGIASGHFALQAVLAAVFARTRLRTGQRIFISQLASALCIQSTLIAAHSSPDDFEGFHLNGPTANSKFGWRTRTGRVTFDMGRSPDDGWHTFCSTLGLGELQSGESLRRGATGLGDEADDFLELFEGALGDWDASQFVEFARDCGGLAAEWNDYETLKRHPQVAEVEALIEVHQPSGGNVSLIGWPWLAQKTPARLAAPPPVLGQHDGELDATTSDPAGSVDSGGVTDVASADPPRRPLGRADLRGPLLGVRVVDLSQGGVGPWASVLLAAMGADVIRIESPLGDFIRGVAPTQRGMSTTYIKNSYGKRAMVLDLKQAADRQRAQRLAASADVVMQNLRPGVADRLGMGYEDIAGSNPRVIYVAASGFGQRGPLSHAGCTDPHMQAFSGTASLHGKHGASSELLRFFGHIDLTTAQVIAQAVLIGLVARDRLGVGQLIETSMLQAALTLQLPNWAQAEVSGALPQPGGSRSSWLAPDEAVPCKDGAAIAVTVESEEEWVELCEAIGRAELTGDHRFINNSARLEHARELSAILSDVFMARQSDWWERSLRKRGLRVGPFLPFDVIRHDRRFWESEAVANVETPWGLMLTSGLPWHFSATPGAFLPPPEPGADTEAVLRELG